MHAYISKAMHQAMKDAGKEMHVDNELLSHPEIPSKISQLGPSFEMTSLDIARPGNEYVSVTMYSDGNAEAKNQPVNERATSLARAVGLHTKMIYGDAFIARTYDNEKYPWSRFQHR